MVSKIVLGSMATCSRAHSPFETLNSDLTTLSLSFNSYTYVKGF